MPTYEYKCSTCSHSLEAFQSITARPLRKCPACGKRGLERVIGSGAALLFKGPGFYITDYRSADYRKAAESDSKGKPEPGKTSGESAKSAVPACEKKGKSKKA